MYAATTEIYTLSLHDALPIWGMGFGEDCRVAEHRNQSRRGREVVSRRSAYPPRVCISRCGSARRTSAATRGDRKSTRLNSSHPSISYAVFCLKKKKKNKTNYQ